MWIVAIVYLILGPLIALYGQKWFPYVSASVAAVFTGGLFISLCQSCEWLDTTLGLVLCILSAVLIAVVTGAIVRRFIWVMIALLGGVAGYFSGSLLYTILAQTTGWTALWGLYLIAVGCGIIGLVLALKLGKGVVLLSTAMIGSYLFMRSWTLFFPDSGYPSEQDIMASVKNETTLELDPIFWLYIAVFAVCFLASAVFQAKDGSEHDELDEYYKSK